MENTHETQASFVPTVSISYNKKQKLDIRVKILENPLTIRSAKQTQAIVRGTVELSSRQIQRARKITVNLVGTKTLHNAQQQMGGSSPGTSKQTICRYTQVLEHNLQTYAVGTYTLPFEFVLEDIQELPATLNVPQCSVIYRVVATTTRQNNSKDSRNPLAVISLAVLWPFGSNNVVSAQENLLVIKYPVLDDPADYVARIGPVVKVGVLGALGDDEAVPMYCVQMDRDTTAPGETLGFALRVYVPAANTISNRRSSLSGAATDSLIASGPDPRITTVAAAEESSSGDSSSPRQEPPQVPYVGRPVAAYKVKCKLVQKVRYVTDHDLVADSNDQVYMFWTKRVVLKELVANEMRLDAAATEPIRLQWEMLIPDEIQSSLDAEDVQVRYDVFVDFYPMKSTPVGITRRLSLRGIARKSQGKSVWCILPLNVLPVSVSTLVANPPEYQKSQHDESPAA